MVNYDWATMIESDGQKIVILNVVDCWKMRFPVKIKPLREAPKQAHLRLKNVSQTRNTLI